MFSAIYSCKWASVKHAFNDDSVVWCIYPAVASPRRMHCNLVTALCLYSPVLIRKNCWRTQLPYSARERAWSHFSTTSFTAGSSMLRAFLPLLYSCMCHVQTIIKLLHFFSLSCVLYKIFNTRQVLFKVCIFHRLEAAVKSRLFVLDDRIGPS